MKKTVLSGLVCLSLMGCAAMQDPMLAALEVERVERTSKAETEVDKAQITQEIEMKKLQYQNMQADRQAAAFRQMEFGACLMNPINCRR